MVIQKNIMKKSGWMELIGNPYILTSTDYITADIMKYNKDEQKAKLSDNVKIRNFENRIIIIGEDAEYFTNTKRARVRNNAKMYADDDKILMISDELERIDDKKEMNAKGNVVIHRMTDDTKVYADEAVYKLEEKKIFLQGNPKVEYMDYLYKADKMTVFTDKNEAILEGNCSIKQNNKEATANKIEYFSKGEVQAILTGNSQLVEFSKEDSVLKGEPVNIAKANKIIYYNEPGIDHALLEGNANFTNFDVKKVSVDSNGLATYKIIKQEGYANDIEYFSGSNERIILKGNAIVKQPNQVAAAKKN